MFQRIWGIVTKDWESCGMLKKTKKKHFEHVPQVNRFIDNRWEYLVKNEWFFNTYWLLSFGNWLNTNFLHHWPPVFSLLSPTVSWQTHIRVSASIMQDLRIMTGLSIAVFYVCKLMMNVKDLKVNKKVKLCTNRSSSVLQKTHCSWNTLSHCPLIQWLCDITMPHLCII